MPQQGTRHPWVDDPESIVERRQQRRQHERSVPWRGGAPAALEGALNPSFNLG
jgi:hypothetical protein